VAHDSEGSDNDDLSPDRLGDEDTDLQYNIYFDVKEINQI
jgi:hypothetical protein